jgi:hypothetical protein
VIDEMRRSGMAEANCKACPPSDARFFAEEEGRAQKNQEILFLHY